MRAVSAWHKEYADSYLPGLWSERLAHTYPILAMMKEIKKKAVKAELQDKDEFDSRKIYIKAVIAEFEADPESINPFDSVALLLLYQHYRDRVNEGNMWLSLHNFGVLVALHLKIRHGIFRTPHALADLDAIIAARFVDKHGRLKKELDKQWQSLVVDTDTLIVSAELKRFVSQMRRAYFMKLQYVMFVSSVPYFPMLVVEAKLVVPGKKKLKDVLLGVGREALLVIDDKSNQTMDQYNYARMLSWAFSKEMFSLRFVSERGASRRGAEEVIFITPDAQQVSVSVQHCVDDLFLLESPLAATVADEKKSLPKLMDEFLQTSISLSKQQGGGKQVPQEWTSSQEKKLRQISSLCASMAEKFQQRVTASRTKKNYEEVLEMKRSIVHFLHTVNNLDKVLRKAGKGMLDVVTTVQLSKAIKEIGAAVEGISGADQDWISKLDEIIKRTEESS